MRWPFRNNLETADTSVTIDEVMTCKPDLLPQKLDLPYSKGITIWATGDFTDVGLDGIEALKVPIARRFISVAAMFQAAIGSVESRERLYRLGEGPDSLHMLMSEHAFRAQKTQTRFRYVLDHQKKCRFTVIVVCSWLRPLEETW